jgi:XTP/dITP diphosphohydrolase
MKLLVATRNPGKLAEIAEALVPLHWEIQSALDFPGIPDCVEGSESYEANARLKALHYTSATGLAALADDSGLEVEALGGGPGVLSARYGAEGLDDAGRNRELLQALRGVPEERRGARYVAVVALAAQGRVAATFRGEASGRILRDPQGDRGFGYDPLFYDPNLHLTFAQMLPAVKRQVSHRGRALAQVVALLLSSPGLLG